MALCIAAYGVGAFIVGMTLGCMKVDPESFNAKPRFSAVEIATGTLLWPLVVPIMVATALRTYPKVIKKFALHLKKDDDE